METFYFNGEYILHILNIVNLEQSLYKHLQIRGII